MCIYHIPYLLSLTYRLEVTLREQYSLDKSNVKLQWGWRRPTWIQFWHQLIWNWPSMSGQCMFQTKEKTCQSTLLGMSSACRAQWLSNKRDLENFVNTSTGRFENISQLGFPGFPPTVLVLQPFATCTTPPKWIYQDHRPIPPHWGDGLIANPWIQRALLKRRVGLQILPGMLFAEKWWDLDRCGALHHQPMVGKTCLSEECWTRKGSKLTDTLL